MNPSGSEFTLRVAICDLVERLKRMQHKCTYLEECRNQLVKEVIRLRLQNEWLAKQINDSPGASSLPQNIQCICNQQSLVNSPFHIQQCQLNHAREGNADKDSNGLMQETDLVSGGIKQIQTNSSSNKDESLFLMNILNDFEQEDLENKHDSIKLLTIQMLKDLEAEMKTGRLKSDLINFVKNTSNEPNSEDTFANSLMKFDDDGLIEAKQNDDQIKLSPSSSANYEAFNTNSDYYSNSHNLNIPFEDLQNARNAATTNVAELSEGSNKMGTTRSSVAVDHNNSGGRKSAKFGTAQPDTAKVILKDKNNALSNNNKDANNLSLILNEEELISIIIAAKNDLKNIHQGLLQSTEKLNKLKSKQLRHFFQKQINLEQNSNNKSKSSNANSSQLNQMNNYGGNSGASSNSSIK